MKPLKEKELLNIFNLRNRKTHQNYIYINLCLKKKKLIKVSNEKW